jgi:hypothetical protein
LKLLNLAHLRVDLKLSDPGHAERLRQSSHEAASLGVPLEAAVILSNSAEGELRSLVELVRSVKPTVCRWLIFHAAEKSTAEQWVKLARKHLEGYDPRAKVFSGTNAYFTELNRGRPPIESLDGVCYSINPQVHAFDNRSLVETLEAHVATVESARQFTGKLPLAISTITLKPRFNPDATAAVPDPAPGTLPPQVDVRQMSLFGAGWTLGSVKYVAESGVEFVTYYETTGWRGVMETEAGSPVPDKFRSLPASVFPLYHVLADVGELVGGDVITVRSSDPLRVESLMLVRGDRQRLLVANLTGEPQTVAISGLNSRLNVKRLNEDNVFDAMLEPGKFRASSSETVTATQGDLEIRLRPFEIARIDSE